ncbi:late secretory pathway protein AVL9 isoform X2 [Jatropha curcas]|uniref:late secretory pathway protein AVL9 isoform X2 n=1 Tax=Jatropha curcas TaxID=180498 RepID=UPI0005FBED92|nr:late secretory pathway protein AVL9 isoform X2 [Jatropha curcas]
MRKCELCDSLAKMFCESDQASLCWDCDAKVHGANFLVAKHSRTLLCHLCQSFTPWTAAGPKLSPIVSLCDNCVKDSSCREERVNGDDKGGDDDDDDDETDEDDESGDDENDENGDGGDDEEEENQVVPLSSTAISSSNSDQENFTRIYNGQTQDTSQSGIAFSLKRVRETAESDLQRCVSLLSEENKNTNMSTSRPLKGYKTTQNELQKPKVVEDSKSTTAVFDVCKLNKETGVVNGISSNNYIQRAN